MKTIKYIITSILLLSIFASCGDNGYEIAEPQLKIVKSDAIFESMASQGSIELSVNDGIVAKSNKDWCTVTVVNGIINISVTQNTSLESRGAIITISAIGETITTSASQVGAKFIMDLKDTYRLSLNGGTIELQLASDVDFEVETTASWLEHTLDENNLLTLKAGEINISRSAELVVTIKFAEGDKIIKVKVTQDIYSYKHYLGIWTLNYTDNKMPNKKLDIELLAHADEESYTIALLSTLGYTITGKETNFVINYTPSETGDIFSIKNSQFLGQVEKYYVYVQLWNVATTSAVWNATPGYTASFNGTGVPTFAFKDNGAWKTSTVTGMMIYKRERKTTISAGVGFFSTMDNLKMIKK